jgi:hypothetical protein
VHIFRTEYREQWVKLTGAKVRREAQLITVTRTRSARARPAGLSGRRLQTPSRRCPDLDCRPEWISHKFADRGLEPTPAQTALLDQRSAEAGRVTFRGQLSQVAPTLNFQLPSEVLSGFGFMMACRSGTRRYDLVLINPDQVLRADMINGIPRRRSYERKYDARCRRLPRPSL